MSRLMRRRWRRRFSASVFNIPRRVRIMEKSQRHPGWHVFVRLHTQTRTLAPSFSLDRSIERASQKHEPRDGELNINHLKSVDWRLKSDEIRLNFLLLLNRRDLRVIVWRTIVYAVYWFRTLLQRNYGNADIRRGTRLFYSFHFLFRAVRFPSHSYFTSLAV